MTITDNDAASPFEGAPFVYIRLNQRKKGRPVAYAIVDVADRDLVEGIPWHLNQDGYATRTVDPATGRKELMARRIMGLQPGDRLTVDHISRDTLDNRRTNLRVVTHAENCQNRQARRETAGTSVHRGVSFRKNKQIRPWAAYGAVGGKQHHVGFFDSEQEAAEAAAAWRRENMPHAID